MTAKDLIERVSDTEDQTNLCVVLRGVGGPGLEVLIVYDEQNRPSIPGGHAKENESHAEACQREVREETGLEVEVQPLMWADHVARKIPANVHYAIVDGGDDARPGGGDVTKVRWVPVGDLGELNGTDRLVINVAANRIHDPSGIVDDAVEMAESQGYAVATVAAPPSSVDGVYLRINGNAASHYASALYNWATGLGWPSVVIATAPFESTNSALKRASKHRQLTPMLESLLCVSDALWRYDNLIGPFLKKKHVVFEVGGLDRQPLLKRGMPADLLENMIQRIPQPLAVFEVGEEFKPDELQCLKDCVEQIKHPVAENVNNPDDPNKFLQHFESEIEPFEGAKVKVKATGQIGVIEQYPVDYPPFANDCALVLLPEVTVRREFKLSELEVLPLSDNYENGACPDCGEPIPRTAQYGNDCSNCTHVFNNPFE